VDPAEPIVLAGPPPRFVSRGGEKLAAALDHFAVDVAGLRCLDAGASTGGFTDCLLQRGAASVVAVDVGHGQLDWSLRNDPRVTVREGLNLRHATPGDLDGPFPVVTADLSFISLRVVGPALASLVAPGGDAIVLVKPQFEAGRGEVGKGGVVTDPAVHRRVVDEVTASFEALGWRCAGVMESPLKGPAGNTEFLGHFVAGAGL
jgi:23S rRNA (cytidine1920-2'-O)/16S rRNA (cytidine1409-2'-O)-methyltransferase